MIKVKEGIEDIENIEDHIDQDLKVKMLKKRKKLKNFQLNIGI